MTSGRVALPVLAGGRSPVRHRHELRREAARLNFSRRASAWIKELLGTSLTLSTDLCYGQCLPELAAAFRAPVGSRDEVRPGFRGIGERRHEGRLVTEKPRNGQCPPDLAASSAPATVSRDNSEHSLPSVPSRIGEVRRTTDWSDVCEGPLQVEAKVLRRLCGEAESSPTASATRRQHSFSPDNPPNQKLPSIPRSVAFEKKWLGDVAGRAAALLRNNRECRGTAEESSSLVDQWSIGLHGQAAPADLLERLTRVGLQGGEQVHRTGSSAPPGRPGAEASLEMPEPPRSADKGATPIAPGLRADAVRKEGAQFTAELAQSRERKASFPDSILAGAESIPLAPSLPAMLVSQSTEHPEPNVAAAIVRQSVRMAEVDRQESPEALAERIRHILQEEARRHGIDV